MGIKAAVLGCPNPSSLRAAIPYDYCLACEHEPFTFLPDNVCAVENSCRFEHAHEAQRVADMGQQHTELDTSIPLPIASLSENLSGSQSVYCVCHSNSVSNL